MYQKIQDLLITIYGDTKGNEAFERIANLIKTVDPNRFSHPQTGSFSEKDVVLITYGDSLKSPQAPPLETLDQFVRNRIHGIINCIHILPFFPWSSDDGFSVTDFFSVDPSLGSWEHIKTLSTDFRLMVDLVINHVSSQSQWFQNYLDEKPGFQDLAIEISDPESIQDQLAMVTRPRALPLLTSFTKSSGRNVYVWTTFSADQVDLNYQSLDVLEKMLNVLCWYVQNGAGIIRLDAIAYLWKEIGTPCIHLPQTHAMVKLLRAILDAVAPHVVIITETNVPHSENISYFGNGNDEAQMVYNFTLPPLLLYSLKTGNATRFSRWAQGLHLPSPTNTFFNFTASHDGIGVRPLEGILEPSQIQWLCERIIENGGQISYKSNPDGSQSPYELNITYVDALKPENHAHHVPIFLASQAIQLVLPGVPAVYIHSLLGSRNWYDGVNQTGMPRSINREKLIMDQVITELANPESFRSRIFYPYCHLIQTRICQPAFHPNAGFEILNLDHRLFGIRRYCSQQEIIAITNVSGDTVSVSLDTNKPSAMDLITKTAIDTRQIQLTPYQILWLETKPKT